MIEDCERYNKPGAIICLDFEKAFDNLSWDFMFASLEKFGFGHNFQQWIKILYNTPLFCIKNNGWISREAAMKRGVRQGCPVSAILFILSIEILSFKINENKKISGLKLQENECCILQYADDSTLTLKDKESICESLKVLNNFSSVSGLKLNTSKCQGIWLGPLKGHSNSLEGITFCTDPIKCLGIFVGTDFSKCESKNWENKMTEVEQLLIKWNSRKLTLYGKSTVINNLVISKLIYNFCILAVPYEIIEKLNKLIFNYLWGKSHKIKKSTTIGNYDRGGLNITDVDSKVGALKAGWIPKLLSTKNNILSQTLEHNLSKIGLDLKTVLKMNFKSAKSFEIIKCIPQFYQDMFIYYNKCKTLKPVYELKPHEIMIQTIWGNEYFKQKDKTLYFKSWIRGGYILVKDLFQENGDWIEEKHLLESLDNTSNWMVEYMTLKKSIGKILKNIDTKIVKYIQKPITQNLSFYIKDRTIDPFFIKSYEIYNALLNKKFEKPYTEKMWEKKLGIKLFNKEWNHIYSYNMKSLKFKKFVEFKYKILLNILSCGEKVHKWNKNVSKLCSYCNENETILHLLYECKRVKTLWQIVGKGLKMNIQQKHIVLGLMDTHYVEVNRHLCIAIVSYSIYAMWCKCSFENLCYTDVNLKDVIGSYLMFYSKVYQYSTLGNAQVRHLQNIVESIVFHLNQT